MSKTTQAALIVSVVLVIVYFAMLVPSYAGWGYRGYNGHYGFSYFSWGNSTHYNYGASNRSGSVSGPKTSAKGLSGGK